MIVEWCKSRHNANSGGRCQLEEHHDGPHENVIRGQRFEWTDESEAENRAKWRKPA